jgi:hypothetical protein
MININPSFFHDLFKVAIRNDWGTIDSPRGESIFVTGVPKSIMRRAVARLISFFINTMELETLR